MDSDYSKRGGINDYKLGDSVWVASKLHDVD